MSVHRLSRADRPLRGHAGHPRIQRLINERASTQDIKREALNDGMLTLREYGIKKLAQGHTTFEEILAHTDDRAVYI